MEFPMSVRELVPGTSDVEIQQTDFTLDTMGRFLCNTLKEALDSTQEMVAGKQRDFDAIIIGGGSFGSVVANGLFMRDSTHSRRILVLEQGPFVLPEHVQNLPFMGGAPNMRVPWVVRAGSDFGYAGLIYAVGGRSLTWGGWSPELLHDLSNDEMTDWPAPAIADLQGQYFHDAGEQIGVNSTNDFVHGPLHHALRKMLFAGITAGSGAGGAFSSLTLDQLPDHAVVRAHLRRTGNAPTDDDLRQFLELPSGGGEPRQDLLNMLKLEAPLAVETVALPGLFPVNKFSSVPLLVQAARAAAAEAAGIGPQADARKRLMIVPKVQVLDLVTETQPDNWVRVTGVRVRDATGSEQVIKLAPLTADGRQGVAVIALGTIESTRIALSTFKDSLAGRAASRMGKNLMVHLRSNLNIRVPLKAIQAALPPGAAKALQVSALFVKGKATLGGADRYFHLQITASGLGRFGNNSEAELFRKIPSLEQMNAMLQANDQTIVITLRGIGEMAPHNPDSFVDLTQTLSDWENGRPRAFVDIGDSRSAAGGSPQTQIDRDLWEVMDDFTDKVALIFANGNPFEIIQAKGGKMLSVPGNATAADLATLHPHQDRRDKLGTTHHEAGTLWMSEQAADGVTNDFGRIHDTTNCYVAGPALVPRAGSPNPMLSGVALGRRTVTLLTDNVLPRAATFKAVNPWQTLFDGTAKSFNTDWVRARNINGGADFTVIDGEIVTIGGGDLALLYYARQAFVDFTLRLQFRIFDPQNANSGIFVRFSDPLLDPTTAIAQRIQASGDAQRFSENRAWGAVHSGFEIQIDDLAAGDPGKDFYGQFPEPPGLRKNRTGAIYKIPAGDAIPTGGNDAALQTYTPAPPLVPGRPYEYEIDVRGDNYTVDLRDVETGAVTRTSTFANTDPDRGIGMNNGTAAGYIGLQSHGGSTVAFSRVELMP